MGDTEIQIGDIVSLIQVYTKGKENPIGLVTAIEKGMTRQLFTVEWFDNGSVSGESPDHLRKVK
jgi:hypothetical protein